MTSFLILRAQNVIHMLKYIMQKINQMKNEKIIFLTDLIEQKLRKEKEIKYYEDKLKEITDKLFFLKKEQDLTNLIINIIQHEKIVDIKEFLTDEKID